MKAAQKALIAALAAGIVLLAVLAGTLPLLRGHTVRECATVHDRMAEVVSAHQEALTAMMEADDVSQVLRLFADEGMALTCIPGDGGVMAFKYEPYMGFYYSPGDRPETVPGVQAPWIRYFRAESGELPAHLKPEGQGYAWHEEWEGDGGNSYYTEKLGDHFWYYDILY
ncbi:MAG: hypothetical protein SOY30_01340 [Eubacteriales bacterium]|nr:hypothetical protein [Eubacteriales bacterium]